MAGKRLPERIPRTKGRTDRLNKELKKIASQKRNSVGSGEGEMYARRGGSRKKVIKVSDSSERGKSRRPIEKNTSPTLERSGKRS